MSVFLPKNKYLYFLIGGSGVIGLILIYINNNNNNNNNNNKNKLIKDKLRNKEMSQQQLIEIRKTINEASKLKFPTKQGILFKKSRYLKEWRNRFFVIENEILYYFDVDKVTHKPIGPPLGFFNLLHCSFILVTNEKRSPMVFKIEQSGTSSGGSNIFNKDCLISCENLDDFNQWFQMLSQMKITLSRKNQLIIKIQSWTRKKLQVNRYKNVKEATLMIQRFFYQNEGPRKFARFVYNVTKVQSIVRSFIQRIRYQKIKKQVMVIQSHFQVIKARNRMEKEFMRKRIASELLSTEKSYVYNLKLIIDIFIRPLVNFHAIDQKVLSIAEISGVFGNWEKIYKINSDLLVLIEKKLENWNIDSTIGDLFIENSDSLIEYTPYVTNYEHSRKLLDKLNNSNTNFFNFIDAAQRDKRSKYLDINSFLIQPIQRLPRYELLLRELLKSTSPAHQDYKYLSKAIIKVKEITMHLNDQQKERENLSKVIQIQQELVLDNIKLSFSSATRLIREGEIKAPKKKNWNYMYLFNTQLVIIQKKEDAKKLVKEVVQLDQLGIRDDNGLNPINDSNNDLLTLSVSSVNLSPNLNNSSGAVGVGPSSSSASSASSALSALSSINTSSTALPIGSISNKFKLIISPKVEITLYFDTPEDKNSWFTDIAITLNRLEKSI